MKKPGPGAVSWAAIRLAAFPAPKAVAAFASSSKVSRTITFTPVAGMLAITLLANERLLTPNVLRLNANTSELGEKERKVSLATICRPGVVNASEPAKGSVTKLNVAALSVVPKATRAVAM